MSLLGESYSRSPVRGRVTGSVRGVAYPSPFFDIGQTYMPSSIKEMFRWCRHYFLTHPIINTIAFKLSQYIITDIVYMTENLKLKGMWSEFLEEKLRYRIFQLESGLDYNVYGNCIVSIFFPFIKMLRCKKCNFTSEAKSSKYYFKNFEFMWKCPSCGFHGPASASDYHIRKADGIRLIRWNPENIDITYNEINGSTTYFYRMPLQTKNDIIMGKKSVVEEVPQLYIESLKRKKAIVFSNDNLFHFKRGTLAGKDRGWGTPAPLPVLKDVYYLQILKKSQESIALEHIVPLRTIFPQASSGLADPFKNVNLVDWRDQIHDEVNRWRFDNNYMPILSFPIGTQSIGGDGRALLLGQEIRVWLEQIAIGMGVPTELIFGGLSYSGSNVSLRMLENSFITNILEHVSMLNWCIRRIGTYMNWEIVQARFKPFKMADDLQRKAYNLQLNQLGKISSTTLIEDADFDAARENELIETETNAMAEAQKKSRLAQANIEGESQMIMMRWQSKAQVEQQQMMSQQAPAPGEPGAEAEGVTQEGGQIPQEMQSPLNAGQQQAGGSANFDLLSEAQNIASQLIQLDENSQTAALQNISSQSPEFGQVVESMLVSMKQETSPQGAPLPEQKPPRRGPGSSLI